MPCTLPRTATSCRMPAIPVACHQIHKGCKMIFTWMSFWTESREWRQPWAVLGYSFSLSWMYAGAKLLAGWAGCTGTSHEGSNINVTTVYHPWISIETVPSRNPSTNLVGPSAAGCTQVTSLKEEDFADAIGPDWRTSLGLVLTVRVGGVVGLKALLICWLGGCRAGVEYINYIIFLTGLVKTYRRTTSLTELGRWTTKLSLARLQQDAELPGRAMERERLEKPWCFLHIAIIAPAEDHPRPHRQRPTKLDFSGAWVAEIASPVFNPNPKYFPNQAVVEHWIMSSFWIPKIWWYWDVLSRNLASINGSISKFDGDIPILESSNIIFYDPRTRWSLHVGYLGRPLRWLVAPQAAPLSDPTHRCALVETSSWKASGKSTQDLPCFDMFCIVPKVNFIILTSWRFVV